jgi:beta-fructofuranosidase
MTDHRPRAHLRPATGWTNDPIGPVYWAGRTHLFHQVNPDGGYWDRPHWGHLVTDDLVRWQRRAPALSPDDDPRAADADGCYSGCVITDGDDAVLFYTGVNGPDGPGQIQATCVARSRDPLLDRWEKDPANPVTDVPAGQDLIGFRDPFVWRDGDRWLQMVGTGGPALGGAAWLFSSRDLRSWTDEGPLLSSVDLVDHHTEEVDWTGSMWECPALARTPQGDALLISVHDGDTTHHPIAVIGALQGTRFVPRGVHRLDLGPDVYAPCLYTAPDGRLITWSWSWEALTASRQQTDGWAGMITLPRELTVVDDHVQQRPLREFAELRGQASPITRRPTADGWALDGLPDDNVVDLEVTLGPAVDVIELRLCRAPDLQEVTTLTVDRIAGELWLDRSAASLDPDAAPGCFGGSIAGVTGDSIDLRIVIDRSIIEVFVAGDTTLTARLYPTRPDSTGVEVVGAPMAVEDVTIRAWPLGSIWVDDDGA